MRAGSQPLRFAVVTWGVLTTFASPSFAQSSTPVYEIRTYTVAPGRLADEYERFRREWLATYFPKHNLTGLLYLAPTDTPLANTTLIYVLRHESREAADRNWPEFLADSGVKAVSARWNANGRIVTKVDRVFATPTDFSPMPGTPPGLQVAPCDSARERRLDEIAAVCAVNARWDEANLKMDPAIVEPILDSQFVWVAGSRLRPKSDVVDILRTTSVRFATYESSDVTVYLGSNMAHAVGLSHRKVRVGASDGDGLYRFTRTFVKRGNRWLILDQQYAFLGASAGG